MIARLSLLALLSVAIYAQGGQGDAPPFLQNADAATKASFFAVLQANQNKPEAQVNAAVDQWASAQAAPVKLAYTQFRAEVQKYQKEEEAAHSAAVASFSAGARAADAKLSQIASQQGLSFEAKQQQITNFINSLDAGVRGEILKAMGGQQ
ncbi:hypothetical protein PRIPAC_87234 [Pristionchus pacificus]|uniref:DUF148 domain-containing protein n=1 Tax=Pristionchus pacificus TaxID=54126 RepID=A0A2A6BZE2_PRIPA|nr:hypothetical protein PRIPAC_87234 [Pristionchus pacificus]|eukprot:PDM71143.1 hypothetical protein PRIPAC_43526 [Pristionchus pacificus]